LHQQNGSGGFITTEKDAVNLGPLQSALAPLAIVPVKMELEHADDALNTILRVIQERSART
jgi:tetraacyldisaccharide-1-P 4'-kinase